MFFLSVFGAPFCLSFGVRFIKLPEFSLTFEWNENKLDLRDSLSLYTLNFSLGGGRNLVVVPVSVNTVGNSDRVSCINMGHLTETVFLSICLKLCVYIAFGKWHCMKFHCFCLKWSQVFQRSNALLPFVAYY